MKILVFGGDSDMVPAILELYPKAEIVTKEVCDVTVPIEIDNALEEFEPEVVINLAGVSNLQPIEGSDVFAWWDEVETNLVGSYLVARYSIKHGVSKMIFIGSVAGLYGKPDHSGYSASKAGVITLVQSLGMEGHNAYCISPGRVDTKLREKDFPGERKETRLETKEIAYLIKDIIEDVYEPGDNIIIRRKGTETQPIRVDKGEPWKEELQVGQPPLV